MPSPPPSTPSLERWLAAATCAAALLLAWSVLDPAFAQNLGAPQPLRGTAGAIQPPLPDDPNAPPPLPDSAFGGDPGFASPTNYGRPRKKRKKAFGPKILRPLPPLQPYATAPRPRRVGRQPADLPIADQPVPGPVYAAVPAPVQPRRPAQEANPYAPLGINLGSLRLTPYAEGDVGFDTNPNRDTSGTKSKGSGFARAEAGFGIASDWSRHSVSGALRAGYQDYFKNHDANRPDGSGSLAARIDVNRDTTVDLDGRFSLDTQRPGATVSVQTPAGVSAIGRPLVATTGAGAGITERFGRASLNLRGVIDRTAYEDAKLSDGTTQKLSDDNYNTYGLKARASYEIQTGISPFVEAAADKRVHDLRFDTSALKYARDSKGVTLRAGSTFELSRILTGELSAGYSNRTFDDARLPDLRGLVTDASLTWSATPLTTVTFKAGTDLAETNQTGSSGAVVRRAGLEVSHALLRNLTVAANLNYQNTAYSGISQKDDSYSAGLRLDYSLTRSVMLRSSFTHERLKSSAPGNDYTANVFLLGLRLQQ